MCKACVSNVAWTTWDDCIVQTHKGLGVLWLSKWRKLHPYLWKYISSFVTTPLYKEWIIWATSGRLLTITFSCYLMVIELGGAKFCLKSFGFQNQTSAWQGFIWNRKIVTHEVQSLLYYIHFEIAKQCFVDSIELICRKLQNLFSFYQQFDWFL